AANANAVLALTSGSGALLGTSSMNIGSSGGNGTATFTNVECSDAGTNKQITATVAGLGTTVSSMFWVGGVDRATGGTAILTNSVGGAYTNLTGPAYFEISTGEVGTGTIILNAPTGFIFDSGGTAPTVRIDRTGGGGNDSKNINS